MFQTLILLAIVFAVGWFLGQKATKTVVANEIEKLKQELGQKAQEPVQPKKEAVASTAAVTPKTPATPSTGVTEDVLAILSAAVCAYLGKPVRIKSARLLSRPQTLSLWAQQGRLSVQQSHSLGSRIQS